MILDMSTLKQFKDFGRGLTEGAIAHRRELILVLILFLVSLFSFGLGYLTHREFSQVPIVIEMRARGDY